MQFSSPGTSSDSNATESLALDRESFEYLALNPSLCHPGPIRAAVDRADYDDAAIRTLAACKLGVSVPAELIADVLVGVDRIEVFLPLARQTTVEMLLELLRRKRFADEPSGVAQTSYAAFALWQLQASEVVRRALVPRLRGLARRAELPALASGFVAYLMTELDDAQLRSIYEKQQGAISDQRVKTFGQIMREFWSVPIDGIVSLLPQQVVEPQPADVPARAATKPGRNEPCPCGSGKKFKKCHGEIAPAFAEPRVPRAARLRAIEAQLDHKQIGQLSRADLAELDLRRLRANSLIELIRRQGRLRDWPRAMLAREEYVRRFGNGFAAEELLKQIISQAFVAGHVDVAEQLMARLDDPTSDPFLALELAMATTDADGPLALLENAARAVVRQRGDMTARELADVVVRWSPSLGIFVARGALATNSLYDGNDLLEWIEGARDDLELAPGDPAQDVFDAMGGQRKAKADVKLAEAERDRLNQTALDLQARLDGVTGRLHAMEQQSAERERELDRALRTAAESHQRATQTQTDTSQLELRALRQKIDDLQAGIRERNEERAELRRELAQLIEADRHAQPRQPDVTRGSESDADDDDVDDLPEGTVHPVRLLRFRPAAEAAFGTVPRDIAANAMRTIGALAAGDAAAWRKVKQAKDMPRQVLIARVGIHYRLLLRTDEGPLEVLDLLTRQNEDVALRRLR
jgi:hypothetical protein